MRLDRLTLDIDPLDTISIRHGADDVEVTFTRGGTEVVLNLPRDKARELRDVLGLRPVGRAS